jgi:hypothetical protein
MLLASSLPPATALAAGDATPAGQVSGTILTPAHQVVKGASVALIPEAGGVLYGASTGEDGRYALRNLANGSYAILVMDPGGNILRKDRVNVRPLFRNLVDFITEPAGAPPPHLPALQPPAEGATPATIDVTGSVITADDQPISEAWLTLRPMGGEAPLLRARTDAEGHFRLLHVQGGYFQITARGLGHVTWTLGPILLEPGHNLSVRLTLLPFLLGHPMNPEDFLVPVSPIPPEAFEKESPGSANGE